MKPSANKAPSEEVRGSKTLENLKHELFCQLYTGGDKDCFGNATEAYMAVYEPKDRKVAQTAGARMLTNVMVKDRARYLLETKFDQKEMDIEMGKVIRQWIDIPSKVKAYAAFNKAKGRV